MTKKPVKSKVDFVRRYAQGEFGNASPTWETIEEFEASGYDGLVHVRNRVAGGVTFYDLKPHEAVWQWNKLDGREFYISAMAPTEKTIFHGEVCQGERMGIELTYTTVKKPMRDALAEKTEHAYWLDAVQLLRRYLCPNSFDWLQTLLNEYPSHVVEFSTHSVNWGTVPGYNTVFWEVRLY